MKIEKLLERNEEMIDDKISKHTSYDEVINELEEKLDNETFNKVISMTLQLQNVAVVEGIKIGKEAK